MRLKKRSSKGVTPAIAAMMILTISISFALVVSAYTFGIFGPNADRVVLTSGRLLGGVTSDNVTTDATASLQFELKNPGASTNITLVQMSESGLSSPITLWSVTAGSQAGNSLATGNHNSLAGGESTSFTLFPVTSQSISITIGSTYSYEIQMSNGQSITGYFEAQ